MIKRILEYTCLIGIRNDESPEFAIGPTPRGTHGANSDKPWEWNNCQWLPRLCYYFSNINLWHISLKEADGCFSQMPKSWIVWSLLYVCLKYNFLMNFYSFYYYYYYFNYKFLVRVGWLQNPTMEPKFSLNVVESTKIWSAWILIRKRENQQYLVIQWRRINCETI